MKVKRIFRASRGRIAATHTAFAGGRTTQKMLPMGLKCLLALVYVKSTAAHIQCWLSHYNSQSCHNGSWNCVHMHDNNHTCISAAHACIIEDTTEARGNYSISGIQNLIQQITVQGEKGGWSGVPVEKSKSSSA